MPRLDWRTALKALGGFAAGLALWLLLSPLYDAMVARVTEKVLRAFEKPSVTKLTLKDDGYVTVDRTDFDPRSKQRPAISIRDLTFNVVLLVALFAISKPTFSDRNIGGFLAASAILAITHVFGAITEVMSIYALKLGLWSDVHYSSFQRELWGAANHFYRLVLMYAIAFALWFVFRDPDAAPTGVKKKSKRR